MSKRSEPRLSKKTCTIGDCTKRLHGRGLCSAHLWHERKYGDPEEGNTNFISKTGVCSIDDCQKTHHTQGMCAVHYWHYRKYGDAREGQLETHGMTLTPIYRAWANMKQRCNDPNYTNYKHWGGRGIKVCERWNKSFTAFYEDMNDSFEEGLWLDRKDNDKDYSRDNCRWATPKEQQNNRTNNKLITHNNKTLTEAAWSTLTGINRTTIAARLSSGWSVDKALGGYSN